jgi:hypothetical protein
VDDRVAGHVGMWSGAALSVLGAAYLATLVVYFSTAGFVFPPSPAVQLVAGVVTFLTVPVMVALFVAIRQTPGAGGVFGTLGLCFAVLFAAVVSINRFVQLTVIRQAVPGPGSADLARFLPYSAGSVMFALEMLGWGFFIALAALCVAPLFGGDRLSLWIRWGFVSFGVLSLLSVIGFAMWAPLTMAGFVAWGPVLLALAVLLTVYYRRLDRPSAARR